MRLLTTTAFAALLFGATVAMPALAASPTSTGCSPGAQRAESEGGGVGSVGQTTRHADTEGGGVGSVGQATRHADTEGGGVGQAAGKQMAAADPCK